MSTSGDADEILSDLLARAQDEATGLGHAYVGAVHILLAVTDHSPDDSALRRLGLDPPLVRQRVLHSIRRGRDPLPLGMFPLTTRARNALSRARAAAAEHGIALVRVEDVLVGIGVQESVAGGVLHSLGVTAEMLSSLAYPDVTPT